tara:strand:+ start:49 stop:741 length:693 start_codon:yes stop_codon:yes gene_type:complete
MKLKKIVIFIILTVLIFGGSSFTYKNFKIEKNNYIHTSTYIAGGNLAGANLYFMNNTQYNMTDFFEFQKINLDILRDYKSQKICVGIFSSKIFKLPITIKSDTTSSFDRVSYEITSDNFEKGEKCINDIHMYIERENEYATQLLLSIKDLGLNYYHRDGTINQEQTNKMKKVMKNVIFYKKIDESNYEPAPQKYSLNINLLIISIFLSIILVYYKSIYNFVKKLVFDLKQ